MVEERKQWLKDVKWLKYVNGPISSRGGKIGSKTREILQGCPVPFFSFFIVFDFVSLLFLYFLSFGVKKGLQSAFPELSSKVPDPSLSPKSYGTRKVN